jgi:hypothetical protein
VEGALEGGAVGEGGARVLGDGVVDLGEGAADLVGGLDPVEGCAEVIEPERGADARDASADEEDLV